MHTRLIVALCTRNREEALLRACRSILRSSSAGGVRVAAVLVVDGGPLSPAAWSEARAALEGAAPRVEHIDVSSRAPSLYASRLVALRRARELGASHVTFFDDDVELAPDYLARLGALLDDTRAAAVGGVDTLLRAPSVFGRAWGRLTGTSSGDPSTLSASGFNGSMPLWSERTEPFRAEYASGCNMTLDVRVLERVSPEAERRFASYSLAEDVYLSARAATLGPLLIDPGLRVQHHRAPGSREGRAETGRQLLVNQAWLARELEPRRSRVAFLWSAAWVVLRAALEDARLRQLRGRAFGMLHGAAEAARALARR